MSDKIHDRSPNLSRRLDRRSAERERCWRTRLSPTISSFPSRLSIGPYRKRAFRPMAKATSLLNSATVVCYACEKSRRAFVQGLMNSPDDSKAPLTLSLAPSSTRPGTSFSRAATISRWPLSRVRRLIELGGLGDTPNSAGPGPRRCFSGLADRPATLASCPARRRSSASAARSGGAHHSAQQPDASSVFRIAAGQHQSDLAALERSPWTMRAASLPRRASVTVFSPSAGRDARSWRSRRRQQGQTTPWRWRAELAVSRTRCPSRCVAAACTVLRGCGAAPSSEASRDHLQSAGGPWRRGAARHRPPPRPVSPRVELRRLSLSRPCA